MKLSEFLQSGKILLSSKSQVKLLKTIKTDDGTVHRKGSTGSLVLDFGNGEYHFENNKGAFRIKESEFSRV